MGTLVQELEDLKQARVESDYNIERPGIQRLNGFDPNISQLYALSAEQWIVAFNAISDADLKSFCPPP